MKLKLPFSDRNLHWTTVTSEKVLLAIIGIATCIAAAQYLFQMYEAREILSTFFFRIVDNVLRCRFDPLDRVSK